ncbi:MAG: calcium/sodium antiporter [Chromatiales bacterium]|nr:calcium/sodium antiporter [Chromatiales bacterium]
MLLNIAAIIAGFAILVWGADRFVIGAAAMARNFGVSPMLIGLTIVGFGTSAPEILVSGVAAFQGNPGLAIGNAIGSNIANIGLILGVTALIAPLSVNSDTLKREYPILLAVSLLAVAVMYDRQLTLIDGLLMLTTLVAVLYILVRIGMRKRNADPLIEEFEAEIPAAMATSKALIMFAVGLIALLVSSRMLVWGAVNVATAFGVSDLVIGLTIVALGTSLPELAASIASALKNEHDLAIGNVIGSNIYNILAVLSMPALIAPGTFSDVAFVRDIPVMMGLTLALLVMAYGFKGQGRINRIEGALLLAVFLGYQGLLFLSAHQAAHDEATADAIVITTNSQPS